MSKILDDLYRINAERQTMYGSPAANFERVAQMWTPLIMGDR
jgi:hypothetical protein